MRLLVIDGSSDAGGQRSPGIIPPDACQPFLRRCRLLGQFDDVANRIIVDIGIDRLRRPAIAAVENGLSGQHGNAVVTCEDGTGAVEVPVLPKIDAGGWGKMVAAAFRR